MSGTLKNLVLSVSAGSLALIASAASAQSINTAQILNTADASVDNFSRNRNTSVPLRARPEYDALGIRAGSFLVFPRLELAAETNDNIYASASTKVDDTILRVRPEVSIESDWSRNSLTAYARSSINRYVDYDDENADEFQLGGRARVDVSRLSNIGGGVDYLSGFEPRTAPGAARAAIAPIELDTLQAYITGSRSAGYLKLSGRADYRSFDYDNGRDSLGGVVFQDGRDRDVRSVTGRVDVAVSPDTAFFVQATGNDRKYDIGSTLLVPNRDSSGAEYLVGVNFEVSALVRGEIAVGYIEQKFDEAVFEDASGFGGRAQLEWFPSELTTVTVAAGRTVDDTPAAGSGGYLATDASLGIDHELLRNVILNARVSWTRDEYQGIDREDTHLSFRAGGTYLINRNLGLSANFLSTDTSSRGVNRDQEFTVNKLAIALVTQF